jgi:hypothetical protein
MRERDDELQRILSHWEAPRPAPGLDLRVMTSVRRQRMRRASKWIPLAAAVLLAAKLWLPSHDRSVRLETTANAAGFEPISNGSITVIKTVSTIERKK